MILTGSPTEEAAAPSRAMRVWPPQPFVLVHFAALSAFFIAFKWQYVFVAVATYFVRMFWVTLGYHRYFSHRSFKTSRPFQFVIAFLTMTSLQRGVLWWAAHHRDHHKHSDTPDDLHSPKCDGMFWAHVGWILSPAFDATKMDRVKDLAAFPELRWLDRFYIVPAMCYGAVLLLIGGLPLFVWGGIVSTVLVWHGSFTINSLAHRFGTVRYATTDASRNSFALALLTCGEGWHNNHHHYQSSANQGWRWWEVDVTYYGLKVMSWLGLVWDLRKPPGHIVAGTLTPTA